MCLCAITRAARRPPRGSQPWSAGGRAGATCSVGRAAPGAPVTAVSRRPDLLDVFVVGLDGRAYTAAWEPGQSLARLVAHRQRRVPAANDHQRRVAQPGPSGHLRHRQRRPRGDRGLGAGLYRRLARLVARSWRRCAAWRAGHGGVPRADKLDIFVTGTDGDCWTAAWEPAFADGWHGWWRIGDAEFPQGALICAVVAQPGSPGHLRHRHWRAAW